MDISTGLQILETLAIIAGVIFAASQLRQLRISRHQQAASELVRAFQNQEFIEAMTAVYRLNEPLTLEKFDATMT